MSRRLAAILAADVVGYSRLMAEDEAGTLAALRRLRRELFHPAVAGHRGKLVKAMGDGWLVEFASAVDAVNCAVQVQAGLERDPTIRVRIGIHLGDITHEEEDVFGDGVNVAARLEALAEPGAVAISDAVYGTLDGTLTPAFDDAGERTLKNIPRPVQVWVRGGAIAGGGRAQTSLTGELPASFPVVAIRPVATSDTREEVRELAAALTSDLHRYLAHGRWLTAVVAETPPAGVFVLDLQLRARGDRLRLEAQLAGRGGETIETQRIDGDLGDSFDWQDRAGAEIASATLAAINSTEEARIAAIPSGALGAEDALLGSMFDMMHPKGIEMISVALDKAPDWPLANAWAALLVVQAGILGFHEAAALLAGRLDRLIEVGGRNGAAAIRPRIWLAWVRHRRAPSIEALLAEVDAILRQSPYLDDALSCGSIAALYAGRPEVALQYATRRRTYIANAGSSNEAIIANALLQLGRDEEALAAVRRALVHHPDLPTNQRLLAAACAHLGRIDEAREAMSTMRRLQPAASIRTVKAVFTADTTGIRRILDGLRLAGLPEGEE